MRLGGIVNKPAAWKKRGRPRLLAVEDPQVRPHSVAARVDVSSMPRALERQPTNNMLSPCMLQVLTV